MQVSYSADPMLSRAFSSLVRHRMQKSFAVALLFVLLSKDESSLQRGARAAMNIALHSVAGPSTVGDHPTNGGPALEEGSFEVRLSKPAASSRTTEM